MHIRKYCVDGAQRKLVSQLEELGVQDERVFDKDDWLEQHEPHMRQRLEQLDQNQAQIDVLLLELLKERRAIDLKYQRLLGLCSCSFGMAADWIVFLQTTQ